MIIKNDATNELLAIVIEIFNNTIGPYDDVLIDEELYARMETVIKYFENDIR